MLCLLRVEWHVTDLAVEVCAGAQDQGAGDCLTDKDWLKCLNGQTVKGGCVVENERS